MTIKGIPITLHTKTLDGVDDFNNPIYVDGSVTVNNVVVGQPASADVLNEINLSGKTISYVLAIPADDRNEWENTIVEFYDKKWRTIGTPKEYMPGFMGANFPWNKQISVERYADEPDEVPTEP